MSSGLPTLPAEGRMLIRKGRARLHVAVDITGRGDWQTLCGEHVHGTNQSRVRAFLEDAPEVAEAHADAMCPRCGALALAVLRDPEHVALPH